MLRLNKRAMATGENWREAERRRLMRHEAGREGTGNDEVASRRLTEDDVGEELPCDHCISYVSDLEFQILQGFHYGNFPFDHHVLKIDFTVTGANLFTCQERDGLAIMGLTDENAQAKLLPLSNTWVLDGTLDETVSLSHPIDTETGSAIRASKFGHVDGSLLCDTHSRRILAALGTASRYLSDARWKCISEEIGPSIS